MRWLFALPLALLAEPAMAGDVAASAPSDLSVTIYRAPQRNGGAITLSRLGGFAVVTETRVVQLPAGESRLRFEGVVDGIIAESAILRGLPGGVIEKNRDAALLSPSSLIRGAVGSTLQLRRTDPATGKVRLIPAQLQSASEEGVVLQTADGIESLRCSGQAETFRYEAGTGGLSARPTLSVVTRSARAITARVTLTYLAEGFDWSASYTAQINPDGKTMDIGGWITLANNNSISLPAAATQIVAGGLNRDYYQRFMTDRPQVLAKCWPMQRSSDIPLRPDRPYQLVQPWQQPGYDRYEMLLERRRGGMPPPPQIAMPMMAMSAAPPPAPPPPPEQLGDLKLYRVPQRTTIAAMQMKQTRLIEQAGVPFDRVYSASLPGQYWAGQMVPVYAKLRTLNDKAHQLGLPLPAGAFAVEQDQSGRTMLLGQPAIADRAENEKVELIIGNAPDLTVRRKLLQFRPGDTPQSLPAEIMPAYREGRQVHEVEIANANPYPVSFELDFQLWGEQKVTHADHMVELIDGARRMRLTIPANDTLTTHFTIE